MASLLRYLLVFTIITVIVHEGKALKCWFCNSNGIGGRGCDDPFARSTNMRDDNFMFSRECDQSTEHLKLISNSTMATDPRLVFVCYKFNGEALGAPVVLRGCGLAMPNITATSCMYLEPQQHTTGNILTCDTCEGDYCNGAAGVTTAAVLFTVPLLLLLA